MKDLGFDEEDIFNTCEKIYKQQVRLRDFKKYSMGMEEIFHVDGTIDKHLAASATELKAALKDLEDTSQTIRNAQKGENDL